MKRFILFSILVFSFAFAEAHPIKMTTGRIFYDNDQQKSFLLINFFTDDLAKHLAELYHTPINEDNITEQSNREMFMDYFRKKFSIYEGAKEVSCKTVYMKHSDDNVLQVKFILNNFNIKSKEDIKVINTLMFDAFDNQSNIIHFELKPQKEIVLFSVTKPFHVFHL
ncbi:hypothetical protein GSB9_01727 [Flavobacteriaceae bacterium GSB9]|nr:hypothetical protein GSB9_01727 [Flavobacteriaceae bacterium GSB9]